MSEAVLERSPRITSGAMYAIVPPWTLVLSLTSVARPKSDSASRPSSRRSRFWGERSRCTIPAA